MYPQAAQIKTKETEFSKNLSAADTDVQKALETIDQLNLDGNHAGLSNLDYAHAGHTGFSPDTHNHDASYSPLAHTHDDRYYTESETDTLLSGKSDTTHNHDASYWGVSNDQTGLTGNKSGSFDLTTTGTGTLGSLVLTAQANDVSFGNYKIDAAYVAMNNSGFPGPDPLFTYTPIAGGVAGIYGQQDPTSPSKWRQLSIFMDGASFADFYSSDTAGSGLITFRKNVDLVANNLTTTGYVEADGGLLSVGTTTSFTIPSGAGTRMMWIPNKNAFRVGAVTGAKWDSANIGTNTFAFGYNVQATAAGAFAAGLNSSATAGEGIALGYGPTAGGTASIALGYYTATTGSGSCAIGRNVNADTTSFLAGIGMADVGSGQIVLGYASSGKTHTATGTGSVAIGQDVNATTNNNVLAFGNNFTATTASSFNIGFGQLDYEFTATAADFKNSSITTLGVGTFGSTYQAEIGNTSDSSAFYSDVPGFWGVSLNSVNGAGWFYDSAGNMVALTDGVNAINATGNSLFTGNVDVTTLVNTDYIYSITAPSSEINLATGTLFDASGWTSVDWHSRYLYASDGSTVMLDWSTDGTAQFGTQNIITTGTLGAGATTLTGNLTVGNNTTGRNAYIYATLGTEKVPSFDAGNWTCTGGWVANGTTLATTAVSGSITPSAVTNIVAGTTYKITMTISASSTSVYFDIGGASTIVTTWGGAGSYTWYVTTLTTAKLTISMASSGSGTITALSIKPFTDATGDLLVEGDLYLRSNVQTTNGINFIASDSNAAFRFTSASTSVLMGGAYLRFTGGTSYLDSSLAGNAGFVMRTSKTSALNGISYNFTSGGLGIGIAPTALLHLAAGTATAGTAPLKFTTQANLLTTPEAGAIEFKTDDFFATITTGAARKAFILDDGARLTATRVPFATTNGRLTDDTDMTFSGDTLTVTKIKSKHYCADGTSALADGTYTIFEGTYLGVMDGTITIKDGLIITYQTGGMPPP